MNREGHMKLHPHTAQLLACRDDITQTHLSLSHMESCYNQVVGGVMEVELQLIQDHLQHLKQSLSELQENTWSTTGVVLHNELLLHLHDIIEARVNLETISHITQEWAELELLQLSGMSLMEGGVSKEMYGQLEEDGQQLLKLTQENRSLYGGHESSETWTRYLDHIDDKVQDGLLKLLLRTLQYLLQNMSPQTCHSPLVVISLQLQETGSVFEPTVGVDLADLLKSTVQHVYGAASVLPRISVRRHGNYQDVLQQNLELRELEQEVMHKLLQVTEETETLRAGLNTYSHLWQRDRRAAFQEFLTYGRQLGPEDLQPEKSPPTLKDFHREITALQTLSSEVTHLDDVILLHGWLQVDLRSFTASLQTLIQDWKHLYTSVLLEAASRSLQQEVQPADDEDGSSSFPLVETVLLLEEAGVQLPEHLAAQLKC